MKQKVAVAMSGGVDSSLVAALLLEQGYDVFGITMELSDTSRDPNAPSAASDAKKVADQLGIEHHIVHYHDLFKSEVIDYFINEYSAGRTPNPCVVCNRKIKYGRLFQDCRELGADLIATGHYVQIKHLADGAVQIIKGADSLKDQSYMLYSLNNDVLKYFIFPLGAYTKQETRKLAAERGLIVANKPESQDICFIPNDDYKKFLQERVPHIFKEGNIVDTKGHILGKHSGLPLYTVGQRKGLGIAAEHPLYVIGLNPKTNEVIVGGNDEVFARALIAQNINFLDQRQLTVPLVTVAKIRYGKNEAPCTVIPLGNNQAQVIFDQPQRAITPGQSIVFYDGDQLIGGGVIQKALLL